MSTGCAGMGEIGDAYARGPQSADDSALLQAGQ